MMIRIIRDNPNLDALRAMSGTGLSQTEAARRLGVSIPLVNRYAKVYGLTFTHGNRRRAHAASGTRIAA